MPGPDTDGHPDIAFTPDGRRLVATSGREGTVRVWSTDTGKLLFALERHKRARAVVGIDVSRDGARIATAGADGSARIFDAETGKQLLVVPVSTACRDVGAGSTGRSSAQTARGSRRPAWTTPFASSTRAPAVSSACSESPRRRTASARTRSSGARTEVGSWRWRRAERVIWDTRTFRKLHALPPTGTPATSAVWSPDGRQVLLEGGRGVFVYDASSGELLRILETSLPGLSELAFSRDGARLAVGTVFLGGYVIRILDWPTPRAASL